MVRKFVVFGLVLFTLGGLLAGCSSIDEDANKESSASEKQITLDKFTKAIEDEDIDKAQKMLSNDSYVGTPVDVVIFPKTAPKILAVEKDKVKVHVVAITTERRYLDAVYSLGDVTLYPGIRYGVVEGTYDGTVSSPHEAFAAQLASGKTITNKMGGDEATIPLNDIFFNGGNSNPEITAKTVDKIISLYEPTDLNPAPNQIWRQVTIQADNSVQISFTEDGISAPAGATIPRIATYNPETDEWSDLR